MLASQFAFLQVALKVFPKGAALPALEAQVQRLQHARKSCAKLCRVYGMTSLEEGLCVILDLYPQSLAGELASLPGIAYSHGGHTLSPLVYKTSMGCTIMGAQ